MDHRVKTRGKDLDVQEVSLFPRSQARLRIFLLTIIAAELITTNTILMSSFRQGYGLIHKMIVDASKSASASSETKQMMHVKLLVVNKLA